MKTREKTLYRIAIALTLVKLCFLSTILTAQQAQGVYISAADFSDNKLSYKSEGGKKCKVKIHNFSFKSPVKIICGDSVFHFSKDSVYGFKDYDNKSHRFYNKTVYEIISINPYILLYKVQEAAKTKYEAAIYSYHFSIGAGGRVFPLTIKNLETSFRDNKLFIDFLEVHFKSNGDLLEYDTNHNTYKLNYLLELSKNQK
ncbi:MAG TPA: hypothetical protein VNZ49_13885 [Bacteroidia bacterium]|jgi:hypothetical protein|nr:hypothetical protein [Bacteroidia bacterium]